MNLEIELAHAPLGAEIGNLRYVVVSKVEGLT